MLRDLQVAATFGQVVNDTAFRAMELIVKRKRNASWIQLNALTEINLEPDRQEPLQRLCCGYLCITTEDPSFEGG
jgi:hypothetical protein